MTSQTPVSRSFSALESLNFDPKLIIDVGAHQGGWTAEAMQFFPLARYALLEPQKNLGRDPRLEFGTQGQISWFFVGAGPTTGQHTFHIHERSDSCSFAPRTPSNSLRVTGHDLIEVVRLDEFVRDCCGSQTPDVIKLDCEGWEPKVLEGMGDLLGPVEVIFLEAGLANPNFTNTTESMLTFMKGQGYWPISIETAATSPKGVMWNVEICFVSESSTLASSAKIFE